MDDNNTPEQPEQEDLTAGMELSLDLAEVPIVLNLGPEKKTYTLRECNGTQRDKYLNKLSVRMRQLPSGASGGVRNFDGIQAELLALCIFDGDNKLVPIEVIQSWPSRTQTALFERAHKLCGLDKMAQERAKNG